MKQNDRLPLAVLLLLFSGLVVLTSLATPLFEAPDEVWHYAYVRWLAAGHGLPALNNNDSGANQEVAQPPLYYAVAALLSAPAPADDLETLFWNNPGFGYQAPGTVPDNKNMLIHTAREAWPWRGAVLAVRLARLSSWLFGLLAVLAAYGLGQAAFASRRVALLTAALVAFHPQFVFISGVVSNDAATTALATAALWSGALALRRPTARQLALTGGLVGLAALTKVSALALLPLLGGALLWSGWRAGTSPRRLAGQLLLFAGVALTVGGWWYLRNGLLYGDPLAMQAHLQTLWRRTTPLAGATLRRELWLLYRSFWGAWGWGHIWLPGWVYLLLGGLPLTALLGWLRRWQRREWPPHLSACLLAALWSGAILAALAQWMRQVEAPHGRLLFPALGAWALLLAGSWQGLLRGQAPTVTRWLRRLIQGSVAGLAALSLVVPPLVIRPALGQPRLVEPAEAATSVTGPALTFGGAARLLGVHVERPTVAPGEWLSVRACWEALAPMSADYTVYVQLIGRDLLRAGERLTYPGLGRFPTSLWPVGRAFCDVYTLRVEPWAPGPELYDLFVGLYGATPEDKLPAQAESGAAVLPIVAQVRVAPARPLTLPAEATPVAYRLGEAIALAGYTVAVAPGGGVLTATLYWRALAVPPGDYTVFVHAQDAAGEQLAQHDGPPRVGRYPTSAWRPGDLIPDEHVLISTTLTADQPIWLAVGMYQPQTLERLPVVGAEGPVVNDQILLASSDKIR